MELLNFKKIQQKKDHTCGIASLAIALSIFGTDYDEKSLLKITKVSKEIGTEEEDMVNTAKKLGFKVHEKTNSSLVDIEKSLEKGHPVIVLYFAWRDPHYSVIVGKTKTHLILADPNKKGCIRKMRKDLFLKRWHPKHQPHLKKWMMTISK